MRISTSTSALPANINNDNAARARHDIPSHLFKNNHSPSALEVAYPGHSVVQFVRGLGAQLGL